MTTFRVTLKRVVYAEVTVDADNAKAVRELLDENSSDAVLDYFRDSMIHSDSITVTKVHKLEAA
jgi:ABC-type phosphate/phosphonate transport system ATPase subunit